MTVSSTGLRMGIDLSDPVRVVLFSKTSDSIIASMTARTGFDWDSRQKLNALASEIKDFWKPYKVRPLGVAGLSIRDCLLFTVSFPSMSKKELKEAIRLQVERIVPGSSHNVRMTVQKWPSNLLLPPSLSTSVNNTTYVVAAAEADSVRAAEKLMKMAGVKPVGVEIPASPASRISWSIWARRKHLEQGVLVENSKKGRETFSKHLSSVHASKTAGFDNDSGDPGESAANTEGLADVSNHDRERQPGEADKPRASFNVVLDIQPDEAVLYLAFDSYPWLMREIPLDPNSSLRNAEILAGEVSRSARFVTSSRAGEFTGGVTVMGSSDKTGFIADYLSERVGIRTQVCELPLLQCGAK